MKLLLNILWLLLGGIFTAVEYLVASMVMMIIIIGIPFGLQTLKLALVALWPFGKRDLYPTDFRRMPESGNECDLDLYRGSLDRPFPSFFGLLLCITIIGIPFGRQHFKLASLALTPFGKEIR